MTSILLAILKEVIVLGVGAIAGVVVANRNKKKASDLALQSLLRVQLKAAYRAASRHGGITMEELSDVDSLYSSYHKMGFNGVGTELYKKNKKSSNFELAKGQKFMIQLIIMDVLKVFVCTILATVCTYLATLLDRRKQVLENQLKSEQDLQVLKYGSQVWNMVDEYFRTHPTETKDISTTLQKFSYMLKSKFPKLTEDEIKAVRDLVSGLKNAGKPKKLN